MIKQIKKIENIAVFSDFSWNSNIPEFKKYNAFYGWNGSGKTVITRILSALEKCDLGKPKIKGDSTCIIKTDSGELSLSQDNIPDLFKNKIRVSNEDFVDENLNWESGKASPILIIGKEKIEQKKQLNQIIRDLNNKQTELETKKRNKEDKEPEKGKILDKARDEIKKQLRGVDDIKPKSGRARDYINYTITDVENILNSGEILSLEEDEILQLKNSLKEKKVKNSVDDLRIDLKWVDNVIEKAKQIFETKIPTEGLKLASELGDDQKLKDWLRIGYEIHKDKQKPVKCEFCKNEISEQRSKELANYFSDALRNLINDIEQIIEINSLDKLTIFLLQKEQFYSEFQNKVLELSNEFNQQTDLIRKEFNKLKQNLTKKKNYPSQEIIFSFDNIIKAHTDLDNIVVQINDEIKKHNEKTKSFKEKRTEDAYKLEIAITSKIEHDYGNKINELKQIESEISTLNIEIKELETKQKELEQKLKEHYFAAEEFNKLLASFLGRSEIKLETVEDGYVIKRNGNIANNLSEGERNAIALIYFLIKLEEENFDTQNGIIVIDDPVSSFDSQHLYGAFGFIKEKLKNINPLQIFIFTHNFPFFRLVRDWMKYERNNFNFYIIKAKIGSSGRYSIIEKIDKLLEENNSEYSYLFKLIYKRAKEQDSNLEKDYIFPNVIRKFLENYISFKVPIGGVSIHKKFEKLCIDYLELSLETKTRIESYCQDQSHPLYQDSPIDFDERLLGEIQSICKAIIELVDKTDPKHYKHLLGECGFSSNERQQP